MRKQKNALTPEMEDALIRNEQIKLIQLLVGASLYAPFAESLALCFALLNHADEEVRGDAILGFGHIVRRYKKLPRSAILRVKEAQSDPARFVRGQAFDAMDDIIHALGKQRTRTELHLARQEGAIQKAAAKHD